MDFSHLDDLLKKINKKYDKLDQIKYKNKNFVYYVKKIFCIVCIFCNRCDDNYEYRNNLDKIEKLIKELNFTYDTLKINSKNGNSNSFKWVTAEHYYVEQIEIVSRKFELYK